MAPIAISPPRVAPQLASLTADFDDAIRFYLNGTRVVLDEVDPEVTLLEYLRGIGLTGTKLYVGISSWASSGNHSSSRLFSNFLLMSISVSRINLCTNPISLIAAAQKEDVVLAQ